MAISAAEIYSLNHMNNVANKVQLGTLIQNAEGGGLADGSVTSAKLAAGAVVTVGIGAKQVTGPKISLTNGSVLIGDVGGAAAEQVVSGDVTINSSGVTAIGAKKVLAAMVALADAKIFVGGGGGAAAEQTLSGDATLADTGVLTIANGAISNVKVGAGAAIAFSKLAALPDGQILVGSGANVATAVAVSGDLTLLNTGAFSLAALSVTDAKVAAAAAIAFSKLAALDDGKILVGSGANVATKVAVSGDLTLLNTGAFTIANSAVTTAKINNGAVTVAKHDATVVAEATGTLSRANLLAMNGTPVELIAAPGAGKLIIVDEIEFFHDYDTAAYTGGGVVVIEHGDGTDIVQAAASVVTGASDKNYLIKPSVYALDGSTGTGVGLDFTASVNQNVRITNATAAFANGNVANVLKWRIRYHVVTAIV